MYCSKCGKDISVLKYCPNCEKEKEVIKTTSFKIMFILSIISLVISFLPLNYVIMVLGALIGAISIIGTLILTRGYESNKIKLAKVFSISGIFCNVVWIVFSYYILPL